MGKVAGILAIVGGAMLIIGGFSGYTMLDRVRDLAGTFLEPGDARDNLILVLNILIFFALLGGMSVLIGGYLVYSGMEIIGKLLIILGMGVGVLSLVISGAAAHVTGKWDAFVASNFTFVGVGLVLSAVARRLA